MRDNLPYNVEHADSPDCIDPPLALDKGLLQVAVHMLDVSHATSPISSAIRQERQGFPLIVDTLLYATLQSRKSWLIKLAIIWEFRMRLTVSAFYIVTASLLAACDGQLERKYRGGNTPDTAAQVAALEDSGQIPKLERTSSLGGIDADSDGVRDDIAAFIEASYLPEQRNAARQLAKALREAIVADKGDIGTVRATSERISDAVNCVYSQFSSDSPGKSASEAVRELEAVSTNTKDRVLSYLAFAGALDGSVLEVPTGDTCA